MRPINVNLYLSYIFLNSIKNDEQKFNEAYKIFQERGFKLFLALPIENLNSKLFDENAKRSYETTLIDEQYYNVIKDITKDNIK